MCELPGEHRVNPLAHSLGSLANAELAPGEEPERRPSAQRACPGHYPSGKGGTASPGPLVFTCDMKGLFLLCYFWSIITPGETHWMEIPSSWRPVTTR